MIDKSLLALGTLLALAQAPAVLADDMQTAPQAAPQTQAMTQDAKTPSADMPKKAHSMKHHKKMHHKKMDGGNTTMQGQGTPAAGSTDQSMAPKQ